MCKAVITNYFFINEQSIFSFNIFSYLVETLHVFLELIESLYGGGLSAISEKSEEVGANIRLQVGVFCKFCKFLPELEPSE